MSACCDPAREKDEQGRHYALHCIRRYPNPVVEGTSSSRVPFVLTVPMYEIHSSSPALISCVAKMASVGRSG